MKYLETFNEKNNIEKELKSEIIKFYLKDGTDYSDSIDLEWDNTNKLYKVWVKPSSQTELFDGKVGLSESHPKGKYDDGDILNMYDYIVLSNTLKDNDPYLWIEHEIGHIIGYRKGYRDNKKIFNNITLDEYPNTMDELCPFYLQMKKLESMGNSKEEIVDNIMVDYEESKSHKGKDELNIFREFFGIFYDKYLVGKNKPC